MKPLDCASAPAGSVNPAAGVNVRPGAFAAAAAANLISRSSLPVGVIPGVVTAVPVPAVELTAVDGMVPPWIAHRWATPSPDVPCVNGYVAGSEPVAVFTHSLPNMFELLAPCTDNSCVHPVGVAMLVSGPRSANCASTRTSPDTTPEGREIE